MYVENCVGMHPNTAEKFEKKKIQFFRSVFSFIINGGAKINVQKSSDTVLLEIPQSILVPCFKN